jgi:hypothetical protein
MRINFRSTVCALLAAWVLHPLSAAAWTNDITCEGGANGAKLAQGGANQFSSTFTLSNYSTAQAATGSESCQMGITAGSDGWGVFGATYMFPTNIALGGSVWVRVSLFVPSGFSVTTNDGMLKFMRVHTANSGGTNVGYHDLLISNPGLVNWNATVGNWTSSYVYNFEGDANLIGVGVVPTNNLAMGKWETYEMNIKFDTVAKSKGGTAEVKIWKNNVLLLDSTSQPTLVSTTDHSDSFYLFTYWNGNAPVTQSVYVDDVIVTSDTPTGKDSAGNACLCGPNPGSASTSTGSGSGSTTAVVPDPPSNVSVQ